MPASDAGHGDVCSSARVSNSGAVRRHSAPTKPGAPSAPKVDLRNKFSSSRFWALANVLSSNDEEGKEDEEPGLLPTEHFLHYALACGFSIDGVLMAEEQLLTVDVASPEVSSALPLLVLQLQVGRRAGLLAIHTHLTLTKVLPVVRE